MLEHGCWHVLFDVHAPPSSSTLMHSVGLGQSAADWQGEPMLALALPVQSPDELHATASAVASAEVTTATMQLFMGSLSPLRA
jgi:hypothetical protein